MIERQGPLSLSRQCELLGLSRAALYYRAVQTEDYELELMALIDRQYLHRALQRETATGATTTNVLNEELEIAKADEERRVVGLKEQWDKERELIDQIRDVRIQLETQATADAKSGRDLLRIEELAAINQKLVEVQGETPLMQACVTAKVIAQMISSWTSIPVGKMQTDEINTVLSLKDRLAERVVGQMQALEAVTQRISTARANLTDPSTIGTAEQACPHSFETDQNRSSLVPCDTAVFGCNSGALR